MEYGAIDLHTRYSEVLIINEAGVEVWGRRVVTSRAALTAAFGGRARMRVLVESSTESTWVAEWLDQLGHEAVPVDPSFAPMYGTRSRSAKTDRRDVRALAEANRQGWFKPVHRGSAAQRAIRQELVVRTTLVRTRTKIINAVRSVVRSHGGRIRAGAAETFVRRVHAVPLPAAVAATLAPLLAVLEEVGAAIAAADRTAAARAQADPVTVRLMTMPGVGPVTALHLRSTLDEITRFRDAGAVTAYLGLVPREVSSAERQHRGRITKAGSLDTRAMLVQAAWVVWRKTRGPAAPLSAWAHQVAARRGRRIAIVGLARRIARVLFAMWRDGRDFEARARVPVAAA